MATEKKRSSSPSICDFSNALICSALAMHPIPAACWRSHTRNTFITSSPRWLMASAAMRPNEDRSKVREVSLLSVDQASSLISALKVVFSALYGSPAPRK